MSIQIVVTPHGRLLTEAVSAEDTSPTAGNSLSEADRASLQAAFAKSPAEGLLLLAKPVFKNSLPAGFLFWREWARKFFQALGQLDETGLAAFGAASKADPKLPDDLQLALVIADAPPMRGLEYLTADVLKTLWAELAELVRELAAETKGGLSALLREVNPHWHLLGRVTFHLAENKRDPNQPFAFLATYTHQLSATGQVQHLPLAQALKQYASEHDQAKLVELLTPVRTASETSPLIQELLSTRQLFQPQAWTISQAYRFLRDVPVMEQSGLVVRVPDWWRARKPPRPQVQVRIGQQKDPAFGSLLDFEVDLALDGAVLTDAERKQLLAATDGLTLLRGKWVEVDQGKLQAALHQWEQLQDNHAGGIDFLEGMRLLAGAQLASDKEELDLSPDWTTVVAGSGLEAALQQLRDPSGVVGCSPGEGLRASLRPYQSDGVRWLWFLTQLGFGACLADDMGLGKTIQVIDLLLRLKTDSPEPSLLVVPASLIGNWKQELAKFAPQLNVFYAHRSECPAETLDKVANNPQAELADYHVVITTYTLIRRAEWLSRCRWKLVVLDEAQAIKNASSAQTKSIKKLQASARIVMTGTPVENQLGDLWSLFDFCCPGLLGNAKQFKDFVKRLNQQQDSLAYGSLRRLVQPYILRRMKTDPRIVPDLPDKTEMKVECGLSRKQAVLYEKIVNELEQQLEAVDGMQRRGVVLATLMKLKQICNHPSQFLAQPDYTDADSAKFLRLAQICEQIRERQEKVLVFTQFQSLCEPLAQFLEGVFQQPGLVLHGGVAVAKRKELVRRFQEEDGLPFFVISVKAGGTGLNLTAASHVIHFDRWWNPAVENQATDRAFRIGQKRNVLVHKFVCKGTLEERIDTMLRDKQVLADEILGKGGEGEVMLTEMSDKELLKFVSLDITRASDEA